MPDGNLSPVTPTLAPVPQPNVPITGLSPSALAAQQQLAQAMMQAGMDYSPAEARAAAGAEAEAEAERRRRGDSSTSSGAAPRD